MHTIVQTICSTEYTSPIYVIFEKNGNMLIWRDYCLFFLIFPVFDQPLIYSTPPRLFVTADYTLSEYRHEVWNVFA